MIAPVLGRVRITRNPSISHVIAPAQLMAIHTQVTRLRFRGRLRQLLQRSEVARIQENEGVGRCSLCIGHLFRLNAGGSRDAPHDQGIPVDMAGIRPENLGEIVDQLSDLTVKSIWTTSTVKAKDQGAGCLRERPGRSLTF